MIVGEDQRPFIVRLGTEGDWQTHRGVIQHKDLLGLPWGSIVKTHLGYPFYLLEPSLHDLLLFIRRRSQIIFPKDVGYILLRLSVGPGKSVIEAGTGSGALTTALAWAVGAEGSVITYDRRADMQELARANLARVGLDSRVRFSLGDVSDGFRETDVDAIFLDLPDPHELLPQVKKSLKSGGAFGAIVPTANQVSALLAALRENGFGFIEALEVFLRYYKTVPERLRPVDRMVAHTGYLVFARAMLPDHAELIPTSDADAEGPENGD
jgi:tRNA (adenine57-N1/adenine58-N1)-methyltransferase